MNFTCGSVTLIKTTIYWCRPKPAAAGMLLEWILLRSFQIWLQKSRLDHWMHNFGSQQLYIGAEANSVCSRCVSWLNITYLCMDITLASTTLIITTIYWHRSQQQQACYISFTSGPLQSFVYKYHLWIRSCDNCLLMRKSAAAVMLVERISLLDLVRFFFFGISPLDP